MGNTNQLTIRLDPEQIECPDDEMVKIYQQKSPMERVKITSDMYDSAWSQVNAVLRAMHPDWDDEESMKDAISRRFMFNIIHPASGLKVDVMIKQKSKFDVSRFSRGNNYPMDDIDVNFAAPEDVIIKKMEFYKMGGSEKHLRDITGILKTSETLIDLNYIEEWAGELFLKEIWKAIQDRLNTP